jgi:hypothetical protein
MTSLGSRKFYLPFAYFFGKHCEKKNYLRWLSTNSFNIMNGFINDELVLWLPSPAEGNTSRSHPCDTLIPNENGFTYDLRKVLLDLKSYNDWVYKLEFYLYLNTNDNTRKLEHHWSGETEIDPDELSPDEFLRKTLGIGMLRHMYEYRGYHMFYSDLIKFEGFTEFDSYPLKVQSILGNHVININENLTEDGFVEFNRLVLLKIKRTKN